MYDHDRLLQDIQSPHNNSIQHLDFDNSLGLAKPPVSRGKRVFKKIAKTFLFLFIFLIVTFVAFYIHGSVTKDDKLAWINKIPIIGHIKQIAEGTSQPLKGEERGRINVMLLGIGGKGHDGGQLTDTIMVLSYDVQTKRVAMLSIPRDLSIPIENIGWRKINSVNALAEQREAGTGGIATSQAVGNILNTSIDYYVKVDFQGFKDLIDQLGGVEVCVDNTFDDYTYPAEGQEDNPNYDARFEHLHVEKGCQKMDSTLALKYARSRHAFGPEGSDFARAARQQKVIQAAKEKLISANTLLNPRMIANLVDNAKSHLDTNMTLPEMAKFWSLVKDVKKEDIASKVLSNSPEGLLVDSRGEGGAYILLPRTGNFSEVQYLFTNIFGTTKSGTNQEEQLQADGTKVQILNGTWINGLASKASIDLEHLGFKIIDVANSSHQNFETSVIYDLTFGSKEKALKLLKEKMNANVSFNLPDWLKEDIAKRMSAGQTKEQPELILILGTDANKAE